MGRDSAPFDVKWIISNHPNGAANRIDWRAFGPSRPSTDWSDSPSALPEKEEDEDSLRRADLSQPREPPTRPRHPSAKSRAAALLQDVTAGWHLWHDRRLLTPFTLHVPVMWVFAHECVCVRVCAWDVLLPPGWMWHFYGYNLWTRSLIKGYLLIARTRRGHVESRLQRFLHVVAHAHAQQQIWENKRRRWFSCRAEPSEEWFRNEKEHCDTEHWSHYVAAEWATWKHGIISVFRILWVSTRRTEVVQPLL